MKNLLWKDLKDEVKSILEKLDINRESVTLIAGDSISLVKFNEGEFGDRALERYEYVIQLDDLYLINKYQHSNENEEFFKAVLHDNSLDFIFIKSPFEHVI